MRVRAAVSVFRLDPGEVADLPDDTVDLDAALRLGFVEQVDANDVPVAPPPPRPGDCGCGKRR